MRSIVFVGEPGIEPGPHGPKPRTLPLCYTPMSESRASGVLKLWPDWKSKLAFISNPAVVSRISCAHWHDRAKRG